MTVGDKPHASQPSRMEENEEIKMRPAVLDPAGCEEPPLVFSCPPQFNQSLSGNVSKQNAASAEMHHRSTTAK